jgi:hypothetical protein
MDGCKRRSAVATGQCLLQRELLLLRRRADCRCEPWQSPPRCKVLKQNARPFDCADVSLADNNSLASGILRTVWSAQKWLQGSFGIQTLASSFAAGAVFTIAQRMRRVGGLLAVPARLGAKVGHVALLLGFL